jgi:alpha-pyrone synthase
MLHTKIKSIGTAVPKHKISQSGVVPFMTKMMDVPDTDERKLRIIYRASGIEERYSVLEDYCKTDNFTFFPNDTSQPYPDTSTRMHCYEEEAPKLAMEAIKDCLPADFDTKTITHIITFSCTGMYAPGLDLDILEQLDLSENVSRTCINFMGCYAAFNALKAAYAYANAFPDAKVLMVGVELCTIHFQKFNEYDHIIANSIFADGAAAVLVEKTEEKGIAIEQFFHSVVREGKSDMAWRIENTGFHMRLSSYVPKILDANLSIAFERLFKTLKTKHTDINHFAIHPGGKKIIQAVESGLNIPKEKVAATYDTLKHFGNMSSVSVLFVLKKMIEDGLSDNDQILSMAFGPGLTVEAALLKVI